MTPSASTITRPPTRVGRSANSAAAFAFATLAVAVTLLYITSPRNEDFWWTDAATFALNGELIRDYIASGLPRSPMAFASAWFLRYPALTISLYPPIFPVTEAAVFAVFGFSHTAAQATVAAFTALAAYGAYLTARTAMPAFAAAAFALVLFATPSVLLWSRQVMMEVPTLAFLFLGAAMLLRYQMAGGTWRLLLSVVMVLAAVYTKQTAIFAAPAFAAALLIGEGPRVLQRRAVWGAALAGVVGLLPLVAFTIMFASQVVAIATGQASAAFGEPSRLSVAALIAYARALPSIVGWLPLAGSLGYLVLVGSRGWRTREEKRLVVLMSSWFISNYVIISLTGHFEERYGINLTVPPAMLLVLLVLRLFEARWRAVTALAVGAALFATSLATHPIRWVEGYGSVAASIVEHTSQDDVILFNVHDTKSLAFSLRLRTPVAKVYVVRAEKLLVNYSIVREWGIKDQNMSNEDIEALIAHYGISLVVLQPGFWVDQPSMARLQSVINSDRFEQVSEFTVSAQDRNKQTSIKIFRNKFPTKPTAEVIRRLENRQ